MSVGSGRIRTSVNTPFSLRLKSGHGAVLAVSYELVLVGAPPQSIERRFWDDGNFRSANPQVFNLPAGLAPGRYRGTVVPVLQAPSTELEISLLKNGVVVFQRTAKADQPTYEGIASFVLTLA